MRYLPLNDEDRGDMLARIGVDHIDALFADIPKAKRLEYDRDLPPRKTEMEVERLLSGLAAKNVAAGTVPFFVGAGAYKHHVPASVDHLIQRSEFLTNYTPYQPEIAQGTLQTIFEFQTQVAALTSMDVANASMYDGSTATVEAVAMARRITKRRKALLSGGLHPHYAEAVRTYSAMSGDAVAMLPPDVFAAENLGGVVDDETSCVVVQSPDLRDLSGATATCHAKGALLIAVFTEVVSLGLVKPPGAMGADIVAGEGQSIGNRLSFGGPYVGLFAAKAKYLRQMPGRLCGETADALGRRGFVLTLSTRERISGATRQLPHNARFRQGDDRRRLSPDDDLFPPRDAWRDADRADRIGIESLARSFHRGLARSGTYRKARGHGRFAGAPHYAPRRRLDETRAARNPRLKWTTPVA